MTVARQRPDSVVAERLRITTDDDVVVRARRYLADGRPVETATSYIPAAFAQDTKIEQTDTGPGGIYARLEEAGHTLARFTEEVGARMPTPEERRALQLSAGVPVLTVVRTAYDTNDVAVEVCDTVKVASAYLLEYDFSAR
ncbi:UTRA domain-containing protein [Mycolicibacterium fortuitum]|nr:UTRA domain-containing protein [Mycolicibacterium fortuitum]